MPDKLVLVVDDDPVYRSLLVKMLGLMDYKNVMEAGTGEEALELTARHSPDLILMDVQMPNRDGIDATRVILTNSPDVKVIMMTGRGTPTMVTDSMSAGAANFLLKPFEMVQFQAVVRKAIGTH